MTTQPTNRPPLERVPESYDVYKVINEILVLMVNTLSDKEDKAKQVEVLVQAIKHRENKYKRYQVIDALCDIMVFATGSVNKFGGDAPRYVTDDQPETLMYKAVIDWNKERKLLKTPREANVGNEISFIIEEMLEACTDMESGEARQHAKLLAGSIVTDRDNENIVDYNVIIKMFMDIIEVTKQSIYDLEFDLLSAMSQVQREIDSRVGSIIDGKFVKDKSEEAQANWYKADFSKTFR